MNLSKIFNMMTERKDRLQGITLTTHGQDSGTTPLMYGKKEGKKRDQTGKKGEDRVDHGQKNGNPTRIRHRVGKEVKDWGGGGKRGRDHRKDQ